MATPEYAAREPEIILHGEIGPRPRRLDRLGHHHRSQEDRDPLPVHDGVLLPGGWRRGAADAHPARVAGQHVPRPDHLQPALHAARHHDGLHGRRPGRGRLRQLPRAAHDRRPRHGVPATEHAVVVVAGLRRSGALRIHLLGGAVRRLDVLCAPFGDRLPRRPRDRRLDPRPAPRRHLFDPRRDQLHRDDPQHARARHDAEPHAAVRVDDPGLLVSDPAGALVVRGHARDAADRPQLRRHVLRPHAGRRPDAVAAPVLVHGPPRGLHHGAARLRDRERGDPRVRAQADLRLQGDRGVASRRSRSWA